MKATASFRTRAAKGWSSSPIVGFGVIIEHFHFGAGLRGSQESVVEGGATSDVLHVRALTAVKEGV